MKTKLQINQKGHTHIFALLAVVVLVASIGTYKLVASHADELTPARKVTNIAVKRLAGSEVSRSLGISGENRTYIVHLQGEGTPKTDRISKALNVKITQNPISGAKVKMRSYDRSTSSGCGHNGPLGHRYRDETKITNGDGEALFGYCTNGDFKLLIENIPGQYKLPGQTHDNAQLDINNSSAVQMQKMDDPGGEGDYVYIVITLRKELSPYDAHTRALFATAANNYWQQVTPTKTQRNHGIIDIIQATKCQPGDVRYAYRNHGFGGVDNLAKASLHGAKGSDPHCLITWNTSPDVYGSNADLVHACVTFVHEYGHMLGYGHTQSPNSVMYATPNFRNQKILEKSNCDILFVNLR